MPSRIAFIIIALLGLPSESRAADITNLRRCIAKIETPGVGLCTAVCVSPEGHLLTVAHCRPGARTHVWLNDRKLAVRVLHRPPQAAFRPRDLPAVLRVESNGRFPFVRLAKRAPPAGSRVFAIGFPGGRFAYHEGRVRQIVTHNGQRLIQTTFRVFEGHSGGPLFNADGQLVGLASTRSPRPGEPGYRGDPPAANWVHTDDLHDAMRFVRKEPATSERRTLFVFSAKSCGSCRYVKRYERELRNRWQPHGDIEFLELGTPRFRAIAARCRTATGKTVEQVPTFWVEGTTVIEDDYRRFRSTSAGFNVLAVVRWGLRAIASFLVGRIRERKAERAAEPEPVDESPDWSAVKLVALLAKRDRGTLGAAGASLGLRLAAGPLRRRVDRALGKRVGLEIVAERTQPKRFAAVSQAAGIDVESAAVVVLIAKRPVGMFRGLERRIAETILVSRLKEAPVDLIFERTHAATFASVTSALQTEEPAAEEEPNPASPIEQRLHARIAALREEFADRIGEQQTLGQRWSLTNTLLGGGGLLTALLALLRRRRAIRQLNA